MVCKEEIHAIDDNQILTQQQKTLIVKQIHKHTDLSIDIMFHKTRQNSDI